MVWYVKVLQKTTTFRRLDLSPSSGGWGRVDILRWARQKELVSITGQTPVRRKQLINTRQPVSSVGDRNKNKIKDMIEICAKHVPWSSRLGVGREANNLTP
jgi:sorbitol-specific phosphotransferase system component IIBC